MLTAAEESKEYYTYLLIDPRTNNPFYVGKGKGRRCYSHVREARNTVKNTHKLQKIRKIESLGFVIEIKKVDENITDSEAKEFEVFIIEECKNLGLVLTNKTNGGDGSSGYKHSDESKEKIRLSQTGVAKPASQKQALSLYLLDNPIHLREGVKEKTSGENHWNFGKQAPNFGSVWTDAQRKAQSERFSGENHPMFGKTCSEERRLSIKKSTTGIKKSTTINMRKPKSRVSCPHCGQEGGSNNMYRWHFDNCKLKGVENASE